MSIPRLLIVEDEAIVAEDLKSRLRQLGYEVVGIAHSGETALALTAQTHPDLVLMDICIQGTMDGVRTAELVKQQHHLPIVFLTAYSEEATLQRAMRVEPGGYLLKPFEDRELKITLEMALYKHQAERKLLASEERLRLAQAAAGIGIFDADLRVDHAQWSPEEEAIFGLAPGSFDHKSESFWKLVHPDDRERLQAISEAAKANGTEFHTQFRIHRHDNQAMRWISVRAKAIMDEQGKPCRLLGVNIDITEQKQTEAALEQRLIALTQPLDDARGVAFEHLFNLDAIQKLQDQFAQATSVASIITHPDGTPITRASNFCRLCSSIIRCTEKGLKNCYHSDAVIGRHHPGGPIVQPCLSGGLWDAGASITVGGRHIANWLIGQVRNENQDEQKMRQYARDIGAGEEEFLAAFREVPSMSEQQFRQVAQALFTLAGQLSDMAYQNVQQARFITDHQRDAALRKGIEARQRAMISNISDVIAIIDQDGINRYKSPNVEKWFGWRPEELVGASTWKQVHPENLASTQELFAGLLAEPGTTRNGECRYQCRDGTYKWIRFAATNLVRNPEIEGILLNYHDISERKSAEEEKSRLQSQLLQAQKMESVGRLAGGVAHDFNNMLQAILGNVALALEDVRDNPLLMENLVEIQKAAQRSAALTRQLLAFARKQTISPRVLDLNETITGLLKMLHRLIGEAIHLTWMPSNCPLAVKMDPSQLDQVLANLAVNARDAIGGVGKITIETRADEILPGSDLEQAEGSPGNYAVLAVTDSGCGMSEAVKAHIFEPFFTTKGIGEGTGLGLATVYGIIRQNGGMINVLSAPGQGTTFTIHLPRVDSDTLVSEAASRAKSWRGTETVLLVEDEEQILSLGTRILRHHGYNVLAARLPAEALVLVEQYPGPIQLLLTDVVMPGMNGYELYQRLATLKPGLRCLFMSGYTADIIAQQGVLEDGVHFVGKPFSIAVLTQKVREALTQDRPS
jgi:PAS domain S-box-containing protein